MSASVMIVFSITMCIFAYFLGRYRGTQARLDNEPRQINSEPLRELDDKKVVYDLNPIQNIILRTLHQHVMMSSEELESHVMDKTRVTLIHGKDHGTVDLDNVDLSKEVKELTKLGFVDSIHEGEYVCYTLTKRGKRVGLE